MNASIPSKWICDYRKPECSNTGVTINGRWHCINHLPEVIDKDKRISALEQERDQLKERREHTCEWYAEHYGKLHDWARKILPEPYRTQFFSCIANGLYDAIKDTGKPYRAVAGFMVTPGGYFQMDSAQKQILFDQCVRAEEAEQERDQLRAEAERLSAPVSDAEWAIDNWKESGGSMRGFIDAFIAARRKP